ncbi:Pr6Pr family membrane protein [candidate division WWE3 bacterium]|uniref:Pr6Pr family membrane protein n=1 Tax=candidate division WWE3 bacterium TaxID=2053526 RepID=A0A955LKB3_UNCKA|nr:Pr6Pr family membrane protein [candidate division WWE3 bacterium]
MDLNRYIDKRRFGAYIRIFLGLLTFLVMLSVVADTIILHNSVGNLLSYFTVDSNLMVAVFLIVWGAYQLRGEDVKRVMYVRGAITLYIFITGTLYWMYLARPEVNVVPNELNLLIHFVTPIFMLIDWFIVYDDRSIKFAKALLWVTFPILYTIYSLIRGPMVDWYPYKFLDPELAGGYLPVLTTSAKYFLIIIVLIAGLVYLPRLVKRKA